MARFPTSIDSYDGQHGPLADELEAGLRKIGAGDSLPENPGDILTVQDDGTTAWSAPTGSGGGGGGGDGVVQEVTLALSGAALMNLGDTSQQILVSPGAGKANIILHVFGIWTGASESVAGNDPYIASQTHDQLSDALQLSSLAGDGVVFAAPKDGVDPAFMTAKRYYVAADDNLDGGTGGTLVVHILYVTADM